MNKFLTSIPVFIDSFEQNNENSRYTTAKLKVFYIGETADHRLFTKEFSDKVITTLPLTPVVAFYSEDDDDFKGHNKTQFIYGVVPDGAKIEFVEDEDSGKTFAVTDVILYTERNDNIGEVAKKIVGKQHSLELDPDTLKYKINRDAMGRMLNIEFLDGQFIGLSVLGDNEKPAFQGSEFFTVQDENIPDVIESCKEKFSKFLDVWKNNGGSIEVFDTDNFFTEVQTKLANYAKTTMQEFQQKIYDAMNKLGMYGWLIENTDTYAVVYTYCEQEDCCLYLKFDIVEDGENFNLENPVEVKARYLTQEEIDALEAGTNDANANAADTSDPAETANAAVITPVGSALEVPATATETTNTDTETNSDKGTVTNATNQEPSEQAKEETEQVGATAASASATALSDSERAELEEYRKQAKLQMIEDYRGELDDDTLNQYIADCDMFNKEELETKLALAYRKFAKLHKNDNLNKKPIAAFSFIDKDGNGDYNPNDPASVIKRYAQ